MIKPQIVEIQTINYCNATCKICPWPEIKPRVAKRIGDVVWRSLLEQISEIQPRRVIPYLNNEPLLDRQLESRIREIVQLCPTCEIELSTNGTELTSKRVDGLLDSGVTHFFVSLFGVDEATNKNVMSTSFSIVWKNFMYLAEAARKRGGIKVQLTQLEIASIPSELYDAIEAKCADMGVSYQRWGVLNRAGNIKRYDSWSERDSQLPPRGCELRRHKERVYVFHNGDVLFCCHDWRAQYVMGNVRFSSLIDIYNSICYQKLRNLVDGFEPSDENFLCRKCKLCLTPTMS